MNPQIVVIGSLNLDIVVETDYIPQQGETVLGKRAHFIPGGKGANQAVALARLGAQVQMIGAVGADAFGEELRTSLQKEGVGIDAVKQVEHVATGIALIQLSQQDNRIIVVPGANSYVSESDIERWFPLIESSDLVLLQLEIPLTTVIHAVQAANRLGKTVILNPAPAQPLPCELLQKVDFITPNRTELALLSGKDLSGSTGESDSLKEAMEVLIAKGAGTVLTTLGANGVALLGNGHAFERSPSYSVQVVDTTGAGDAFNAGLAYAVAKQMKLREAVAFAGRVAALSVTKLGAQAGMPTLEEVMTIGMCLHEKISD